MRCAGMSVERPPPPWPLVPDRVAEEGHERRCDRRGAAARCVEPEAASSSMLDQGMPVSAIEVEMNNG
jgi:hypothetical protein